MKAGPQELRAYEGWGRHAGQGAARGAQPHVHHPRQQHKHGTAAKPDRLGRNGDYLRERGGHRIDGHRDEIRQLERHAAQGVRPRPPVPTTAAQTGNYRNHRLLLSVLLLGHARTDKAAHLLAGERTVLAKHILLHAPCRQWKDQFGEDELDISRVHPDGTRMEGQQGTS